MTCITTRQLLLTALSLLLSSHFSSSFITPTPTITHTTSHTNTNTHTTSLSLSSKATNEHDNQSSSSSSSSSSNKKTIPTTSRVIAAQALIVKKNNKKNNNNNPVTKLEANPIFITDQLSQRDKNFARNLVSTTTRRVGQIDALLGVICTKYPPKSGKYSGIVRACLRMGAAQILFMDTKEFAAVKETVNVLKHSQYQTPDKLISFVNAILRRIAKEGKELLQEHTSITDNITPWLLEEWNQTYGKETTLQIITQLLNTNSHQHIDISLNIKPSFDDNSSDDDDDNNDGYNQEEEIQNIINEFEEAGDDLGSITLLPNKSLRIKKGMESIVSNYPLYKEGKWWVQDVSSTLPVIGLISALHQRRAADDSSTDFSNLHVVDMCAAPGGKTAQLLAAGFGKVTAIEANERRCRRLRENLDRLGLEDRCEVVVSVGQDYLPPSSSDEQVAAVLVDVPCSATGTGNRRPDVLQKDTADLESLLQIQGVLANHCVDNVLSKGGVMVYATCSLLKSESEDQVMKLVQRRDDVETLPFTPGEIPGFDNAIDENGWLRVLPGTLGGQLDYCDGFFVARLVKI